VAADLQPIYRASTIEEAGQRLDEFAAKWDGSYRCCQAICVNGFSFLSQQ
jgi:transposase-like protein